MPRRKPPLNILIVVGYGTNNKQHTRQQTKDERAHLIVAGRSLAKAEAFCAGLPEGAQRTPAVFDRQGDVAAGLAELKPDVVVDATGPFQAYGDDA